MADKATISWNNGRREVERKVNLTLHVDEFRGLQGYPWVIIAANSHLSVEVLHRWLESEGVGRSQSWIRRRIWLFRREKPGCGVKRNADGKDERAFAVMADNPTVSLGVLTRLLAEHGIRRSKEWVRRNRTTPLTVSIPLRLRQVV